MTNLEIKDKSKQVELTEDIDVQDEICDECGHERWKHFEGYSECDRSCGCYEFIQKNI